MDVYNYRDDKIFQNFAILSFPPPTSEEERVGLSWHFNFNICRRSGFFPISNNSFNAVSFLGWVRFISSQNNLLPASWRRKEVSN